MILGEAITNFNFNNKVRQSKLVVLYGPSGAGKTFWKDFLDGELKVGQIVPIVHSYPRTLWKEVGAELFHLTNVFVRHFEPFNKVLTMTTRPPREYEKHLVHYRFLTREEFSRERELGNMLEETENFGHCYGSSRADMERALKDRNAIIVLDNKGVKKLKEVYGDRVVAIYLKVDPVEMEERMTVRGESKENIQKRLNSLKDKNHQEAGLSDYILNSSERIDAILRHLLEILLCEGMLRKDVKHVVQPKFARDFTPAPINVISKRNIGS